MISKRWFQFLVPIILFTFLISSCGGSSSSAVYVWIDVPVDGLSFPDIRPVTIEGHATSPDRVRKVELFVDGEFWSTLDDLPTEGTLSSFQAEWRPPSFGTYSIHAIAYGSDGSASQYDEVRISFGEKESAEEIPTEEETAVEEDIPAEGSIQFWADPETIEAGSCTDIKWHVENVKQVIFGGAEQAFDGTYQDCLCKNQTYTLTIINQDETEEKRKLNITVTGSCETPEPEQDTSPPPAPVQAVPANGLSLDCKPNQNLVWKPVNDESGISQYQVQAQRHSGDNNWTDIPGSVFNGISGKQQNISVECGWYYRWRVRAVDGKGNVGPWSGWWTFAIALT